MEAERDAKERDQRTHDGDQTAGTAVVREEEFVNANIVARRINPAHPEAVFMTAGRVVLMTID